MLSAYGDGPLLAADDPHPVTVHNRNGGSPFVFVGDHAGNVIPCRLGTLGVSASDRERHIAWDIGTAGLGRALAARLDAPFVEQTYSRLVIDCNRAPGSAGSILTESDETSIPGNVALGEVAARHRVEEIHAPYQAAIGAVLSDRCVGNRAPVLISLHSFTPSLGRSARPWPIGLLYEGGRIDFSRALLATLRASDWAPVGDNQPYRMDETDYTVPLHAGARELAYAEIEIRQDGLATAPDIERVAERLAGALDRAFSLDDWNAERA